MFGLKTVDGILKKYKEAIGELEEVVKQQQLEVDLREEQINRLSSEIVAASTERDRAASIALKMRAVFE